MKPKFKVIALDIEGTLISNAFSQIPRPGLSQFLEFCHSSFERVVLFTAVPEDRVRSIVQTLARDGNAPPWTTGLPTCVQWNGQYKDLRFVSDVDPTQVLLVDDQEAYVRPDQKSQWVPIPEFTAPYSQDDTELARLQITITGLIDQGSTTSPD